MRGLFFKLTLILLLFGVCYAQTEGAHLVYKGKGGYELVERTDLRRYVNGSYSGLTSREIRSYISPAQAPLDTPLTNGRWYDGSFYVMEKTESSSHPTAPGIHDTVSSVFHIAEDGKLTMYEDNGYPSFRSFPAFTTSAIKKGDSWRSSAERAVDPLNTGVFTHIPMNVLYTFCGAECYNKQDVYRIKAVWKTEYNKKVRGDEGSNFLIRSDGGHKADILVSQVSGAAILIKDSVDETFFYSNGDNVTFKGTISLFTEFPPAQNYDKLIPALQRVTTDKNDMVIEKTPAGIRISLRNIRFKPDSDEILPQETGRLDEIAETLSQLSNSQFLVEGHTARTGDIENEMPLSLKRARTLAAELVKRGVSSSRFLCKGWGGQKPVASNDTEEGRAQNRRVEITILE